MSRSKIQQIFDYSWEDYLKNHTLSSEQERVGYSIINCKTKKMGYNVSTCTDCGHTDSLLDLALQRKKVKNSLL